MGEKRSISLIGYFPQELVFAVRSRKAPNRSNVLTKIPLQASQTLNFDFSNKSHFC